MEKSTEIETKSSSDAVFYQHEPEEVLPEDLITSGARASSTSSYADCNNC